VTYKTRRRDYDNYFCDSCYEEMIDNEEVFTCHVCDGIFTEDSIHEVCSISGFKYCYECFEDEFYRCNECGKIVHCDDNYGDSSGNNYCIRCYSRYTFSCAWCDENHHNDNFYGRDLEGASYCEHGYYQQEEESPELFHEPNNYRIHSYSHKPLLTFHKKNNEINPPFFGIELEYLVNSSRDREDICRELGELYSDNENLFFHKEDGSISGNNGQELVTMPCSLEFHKTSFPWEEITRRLDKYDSVSHNASTSCGLHIHVSRNTFPAEICRKIDRFFLQNRTPFEKLSRRKFNNQYCVHTDKNECEYGTSSSRYEVINFRNHHTIEFRGYKGTLLHTSILSAIELTSAVFSFCNQYSWDYIFNNSDSLFPDFIQYIIDRKGEEYHNISQYGRFRKLAINHGVISE